MHVSFANTKSVTVSRARADCRSITEVGLRDYATARLASQLCNVGHNPQSNVLYRP